MEFKIEKKLSAKGGSASGGKNSLGRAGVLITAHGIINKSFARNPNVGSVKRHPPPAFGGFSIPYFFAISSCALLVLPLIIPRFSLLISPFFSGSVSGS